MNYESAQGECARKGAIILPFKDAEIHSFVTAWAGASVGVDVWIGIRKQKWKQMYDNDDSLPQPLQVRPEKFKNFKKFREMKCKPISRKILIAGSQNSRINLLRRHFI